MAGKIFLLCVKDGDLCASFQASVTEVLVNKTFALAKCQRVNNIIVAGGVSANKGLKERFEATLPEGFNLCIPSIKYCTDNAAMIAKVGHYLLKDGVIADLTLSADPSWQIENFRKYKKGE